MHAKIQRDGRHPAVAQAPLLRHQRRAVVTEPGEAVLRHFDVNLLDLAEAPVGHHLPQFPQHRIAGVVVGHRQKTTVVSQLPLDRQRFGARGGQRLFANDRQPGPQATQDLRFMLVGRRQDNQRVDLPGLAVKQLVEAGADQRRIKTVLDGRGPVGFGVTTEAAANQFKTLVHLDRDTMHPADRRVVGSTEKGHAQPVGSVVMVLAQDGFPSQRGAPDEGCG
jgi:hypothetical protein